MSDFPTKPSGGWTIDEAIGFIRRHQAAAAECGYVLSLSGGVLKNCLSWHDLDIVCTPDCWRDEKDTASDWNFFLFCTWLKLKFTNRGCSGTWNGQMWKYSVVIPDGRWIDWLIVIGKHDSL